MGSSTHHMLWFVPSRGIHRTALHGSVAETFSPPRRCSRHLPSTRSTHMSLAPDRLAIGIRRHFTTPGVHPYDEVVWERRDARISNWKDGTVAFEQLGVEFPTTWSLNATNIVAQKYFRGTLGTARARDLAAPGHRPCGRHHHHVGRRGRLLRRRGRGRGVPQRAEVHPRHPAGRVQQPGVVQHRRQGRAPAGQRLLHPRRSTTR